MTLNTSQHFLWLAILILSGALLYQLSPVLTPFLLSMLLAYLLTPIADRLEKIPLTRTVSVCIVFLLMLILIIITLFILFPIIQKQIQTLIIRTPEILDWLETHMIILSNNMNIPLQLDIQATKDIVADHWRDIGNIMTMLLQAISSSSQFFLLWFGYLALIPVLTFYLLRDWYKLLNYTRLLFPRNHEEKICQLIKECHQVLAAFLRGQLLVMFYLSMIYSIGLWLAGVEFSLLIGITSGLLSFIPYLGVITGMIIAGLIAFIQYQDLIHLVYVMIVFIIGQSLEGMVLSPLLVGDRIGLHPVMVIFSVMVGGQLLGFFGMLISLPMAAILVVLLRHLRTYYINSNLFS